MASLLNGLSTLGQGVAQFAGAAGLEQQKSDLQRQSLMLADQLATTRESVGRQEAGQIAAASQGREFAFKGGESAADRALRASEGAATRDAEMARERERLGSVASEGEKTRSARAAEAAAADERQAARERAGREQAAELGANAPTPEIKNAKWWAGASPEERQAYRSELMAKAGLPEWMSGDATKPSAPPGSASTDAAAPSTDAAAPTAVTGSNRNDKALENVPGPAASIIKGMVEGRISPPTSFAMAKPYWQSMMAKAAEYDPTFDQTTWAGRVATKKDFASGQSAKAVTAMNTALGHAGTLMDDFEKLNNGSFTPLNAALNYVEPMFGDSRQTKAQQTVDALASEARKVFAASGGGNLTELLEWQKSFPLNGSPTQQKAALTGFVDLLDGRLHALSDQYNRGMGKTDDPINLLEGKGRSAYMRLTGREPENATGYQLGKPPTTTTGPRAATSSQDAEAAARPPLSSFMGR